MSNESPKRALAIYPDLGSHDWIQSLRLKHDPLATKVAPHITLVFPFESDLTNTELKRHMVASTKDFRPFSVALENFTLADESSLWLTFEKGKDNCVALHDRLYSGALASFLRTDIPYKPHITLGTNLMPEQIEEIRNAFSEMLPVEFTVDRIGVETIDSADNGTIEFEIVLG